MIINNNKINTKLNSTLTQRHWRERRGDLERRRRSSQQMVGMSMSMSMPMPMRRTLPLATTQQRSAAWRNHTPRACRQWLRRGKRRKAPFQVSLRVSLSLSRSGSGFLCRRIDGSRVRGNGWEALEEWSRGCVVGRKETARKAVNKRNSSASFVIN